jgi:hypothetical protein
MKITKILYTCCKIKSCTEIAAYKFTDIKNHHSTVEEPKTITLGYACDKHFDKVNNLLREIYNK